MPWTSEALGSNPWHEGGGGDVELEGKRDKSKDWAHTLYEVDPDGPLRTTRSDPQALLALLERHCVCGPKTTKFMLQPWSHFPSPLETLMPKITYEGSGTEYTKPPKYCTVYPWRSPKPPNIPEMWFLALQSPRRSASQTLALNHKFDSFSRSTISILELFWRLLWPLPGYFNKHWMRRPDQESPPWGWDSCWRCWGLNSQPSTAMLGLSLRTWTISHFLKLIFHFILIFLREASPKKKW